MVAVVGIAQEPAAVAAGLVQLVVGYWAHFAVLVVAVVGEEEVLDCCLLAVVVVAVVGQVVVEAGGFAVGQPVALG